MFSVPWRRVPRAGRMTAVVLLAVSLVAGYGFMSPALPVAKADPSPYYLVVDPLPPNPARVAPRVLAFSVGPLAAQAESDNWTFQDIARFAETNDWNSLPAGDEHLSFAGRGGVTVAVLGAHLTVGVVSTGTGSMTSDFVKLMRNESPSVTDLSGNFVRTATWTEAAVRAGMPVPFLGNFLGLRGLRVGAGLHLLQGQSFLQATGSQAQVVSLSSRSGTGTAFDVGLSADLSRSLSAELAYLGAGEIRWTGVTEETVEPGTTTSRPAPDHTYPLPAALYAGLRWRPAGLGALELAASYARVDINRPETAFTRLNGEARFNLFFLHTALGAVQDDNQPTRLYARLGVGPLTVGLLNLEEAFKGTAGRSLGLSAQLSFGI